MTSISRRSGQRGGVDLPGALLVTSAAAALIYGLVTAGDAGWGAPETLIPLVLGVVLAAGSVAITIGAHLAARLVARVGARAMAASVFVLATVGLGWLSRLPATGDALADLLPGLPSPVLVWARGSCRPRSPPWRM